ncbi:Programmed cell death activator egl-1 [Caenorhabditis elegans]|uniref:Programmed cell death activator egl-1 n=2 Tax=Caenorhabditis elegans TaxID=6239 RepID=EGL1_CAEEL|nr:Programmed cell death activator egl-1 [Caenorhabditis elegans]O61667.2 RecName: Full=Programmed cell death activator egl-1; AltName: Full=Egg-laying defective protein 1 [Caenorhabditis elegans]CAB82213.2 Programmed cell death activator egl-1 [Caenorhabditis elegans]|eukprot:NP_506575.2 Programmed cell death activator egl-1 [Caenorhabditis elegans]
MLMLTFASTSSDLLPMSNVFDVQSSVFYNEKNMFYSSSQDFSSCEDSSQFADDSGFFDDSEISSIGYEIGSKLAAMCDDFDAQMMSYSAHASDRSLFHRLLDFFAF